MTNPEPKSLTDAELSTRMEKRVEVAPYFKLFVCVLFLRRRKYWKSLMSMNIGKRKSYTQTKNFMKDIFPAARYLAIRYLFERK